MRSGFEPSFESQMGQVFQAMSARQYAEEWRADSNRRRQRDGSNEAVVGSRRRRVDEGTKFLHMG